MFFLYDNLTALILGGAILMILFAVQARMHDTNIEQTGLYTAKNHALDLGDWLQEELGNAGSGVPINESFIEDYVIDAQTENTQRFSFLRKIQATDATPTLITYELVPGETIMVDGEPEPLYQLQRCEGAETCPVGSPDISGKSPPLLTFFRIDLLDENGGAWTAGTSSAHYLRVRFSITSALTRQTRHLRTAYWGTVLPLRVRE